MKSHQLFLILLFFSTVCHGQYFNATVTGGYESGAFICGDGFVYAWGEGSGGEIGDNGFSDRNVPVQVKGINNVGFLNGIDYINGATGGQILALKGDTVIWWGTWMGAGGTWYTSGYPIYLSANASADKFYGVKDVYSGVTVSYAIKNDGTLWAWGSDGNGKLGDDGTVNTHRTYPVSVVSNTAPYFALTNIIAVSAGDNHAMALRSDGTVWTWGLNSTGQLGTGNTTNYSRAVQVRNSTDSGFLTGIKQISAIDAGCLALDSSGQLWAWGDNWAGQLGINPATYPTRNLPTRVSGIGGAGFLTNVHEIKGGNSHSLILLNDGTIAAFGRNNAGQLGRNNTTNNWSPQLVRNTTNTGPLTGVARIYRGDNFNFAADSSGIMYTWGDNSRGQLGLGDNTNRLLPVPIALPAGCSLQILPVELTEFKVRHFIEQKVALTWATVKEENFSHFIVHRSFNGTDFEMIGEVASMGIQNDVSHYTFSDNLNGSIGNIYYKLEMTDFNGQSTFSSVIHVSSQSEPMIELFPNPSQSMEVINLNYFSDNDDQLYYSIQSIVGEEIGNGEINLKEGYSSFTLPAISELGMYIVSVYNSTFKKEILLLIK